MASEQLSDELDVQNEKKYEKSKNIDKKNYIFMLNTVRNDGVLSCNIEITKKKSTFSWHITDPPNHWSGW